MCSERSMGSSFCESAATTDCESAKSRQSCADMRPENRPPASGKCATEANRLKIGNPICSSNVLFCFLQARLGHIESNQ